MSEEIKFDHFKDINELLEHIDLWYREDDIEYTRWFGLEDLYNLKIYMTSLQQKVEQQEKEIDRLNKEVDRLNYIKSKATDYLIKAIKIDSEDDNCMCLERHEYKILLDMLLKENNK